MAEDEAPAKVIDLMEALRKSLDSVGKAKKKPAKATAGAKRGPARPQRPDRSKAAICRELRTSSRPSAIAGTFHVLPVMAAECATSS